MASASNANGRRIMIITSDEKIIDQIRNNNKSSTYETIILKSEEDDDELVDPSPSDNKQSKNQKKAQNISWTCVICGSSATGRNFGVITCESCKLFFRRNALKHPATVRCHHQNTCEITLQTRRRCPACRLAKCLRSGMKRERLLRADEKAAKRHRAKIQSLASETNNETNEESSQLEQSTYPNHLISSTDTNPHSRKLTNFSSKSQRAMLSSDDIQRIDIVRMAFGKRIEIAARNGLPWDPSTCATTLLQHLNARAVPAMRLLAFFKQIPEFNQINVEDKMILAKYNLMPLIMLNSALSFDIQTKQIRETKTDVPWNSSLFHSVHGDEICMQVRSIFLSFVRIGQHNQTILQLALVVLIFTKGLSAGDGELEPILNDGMTIYRAQSYYTELLWKYLETVHGFRQAFRIFSTLITRFLSWQILEKQLRYNVQQNLSTTATGENDLLPLMKSLFHIS